MSNGNGDRFEAGFGSWSIGIRGPNALLAALLILLLVGFTYLNINEVADARQANAVEHNHIVDRLERLIEEARLIAYLVSLPETDRPRVILPRHLIPRIKPEDRDEVEHDVRQEPKDFR